MATEPIPASLSLDVATTIAQLRRENDRLQHRATQLEDQVRALIVLQGIANTISAELNLPAMLRRIAIAALRLTSAQASAVYLVEPGRSSLVVESVETVLTAADSGSFGGLDIMAFSQPGTSNDDLFGPDRPRMGLDQGVAGWVATNGMVVLVPDAQADPRFTPDTLAADSRLLGVHPQSLVAVPLVFNNIVTGVLEVVQTGAGEGFDASSLDLMRTLAAQAATAVANAQLYRRLRAERDRIIQTQEDERKRLGRDLHDGPAQKLAQIAMSLEFAQQLAVQEPERVVPELQAIREQALSTTREIRNLLFDLRPLVLDAENGGLVAALSHFLERFEAVPGPRMHLHAEYPDRLSHNVELTVFAIIQEAVNNVLKHANAQNCWIDLRLLDDKLIATIRDDGDGFDVRQVQDQYEQRGSWGLLNMLERAELVEAKFHIASQPGKGTIMSLEVPR
jgi:signal transduction histidine kinase